MNNQAPMRFYIYKITNLINDKTYIGKTYQPEERFSQHIEASNSGSDRVLPRAIRKYGSDAFEFKIIAEYLTGEEQTLAESAFISQYDCCILDGAEKGYNMTRGGDGFTSEETSYYLNRRTEAGGNPFSKGGSHYEAIKEQQRQLIESGQHIFQSEEHKSKISAMQRRRIAAGDHPFVGAEHSARSSALQQKRIADGTFHMHQPEYREIQRQKALNDVASGNHNFVEVKICPVCGKSGKGPMMRKWHFDNCGRKFVYYTDGVKSFRIPEDVTPDPTWVRGMAPKR